MLRSFFVGCLFGVLALYLSGCKANPYCLNCSQTQGQFGGDSGSMADLAGADLTGFLPDLAGSNNSDGMCVPTVETCNGVDDDCNGTVDNVDASRLESDPNNCGACGNACNYAATHQFGACVNGACMPSGCTPGFVDADNDPSNGCELQCAPTTPPTEVCDGLDNDCNGTIDDDFTNTHAANGAPNYDKDINNCGGCGFVCNLQGAVNKCGVGVGGQGVCQVDSCVNVPGVDTFKHDPTKGDINVTGCEYHCATASSTAGDCNAVGGGGCTFPAETCNGADDDCNFLADDSPTDPDLMMPCGSKCPGGLLANCRGACTAGTTVCTSGIKLCMGGSGPSAEICDGVDNNCDGQVDELFTMPSPAGYAGGNPQMPLYNSDPNNCGGCSVGNSFRCQLANATNGCHSATPGAQGNCYVVSCNSGFNYAPKTDSDVNNPTCNVTSAARDSTAGNVNSGVGCQYTCPMGAIPSATESVCDAKDNNCDGCIDNGLTAPTGLCATQGGCNGQSIPIVCRGASGWKCNYAAIPLLDVDGNGNLATIETKCDARDNNCNGFCDENFPNTATPNNATLCPLNPNRAAAACTAGQGLCQTSGTFCCGSVDGTCTAGGVSSPGVVCSALPNTAAAVNETCNGQDDNCNGLVDDPNAANGRAGYFDATVRVTVPAGDTSLFGNSAQHTVYVYPYEAARPDANSTSPGGLSSRACAKSNVIPWTNATQEQARSACAAAGGRLCTAWEWQSTCQGPFPSPSPMWSYSSGPTSYNSGVCNDQNRFNPDGIAPTGSPPPAPNPSGKLCAVTWPAPNGGAISDLSGNVFEWTHTPATFEALASGAAGAVSGTGGTNGQMRLTGLANLVTNGVTVGDIVTLTNAGTHNGSYQILTVVSETELIVLRSGFSGGTQAGVTWSVANTYFRIRGGSYTSPEGGTTCEFDFDIVPPTFANSDVGFRCCFDRKPCAANGDCAGIGPATCSNGLCNP